MNLEECLKTKYQRKESPKKNLTISNPVKKTEDDLILKDEEIDK